MQFFNPQEAAPGNFSGQPARVLSDRSSGEENSRLQLAGVFLTVLLAHVALSIGLRDSPELEKPAEPLVMEVAFVAEKAPEAVKPASPPPPAAQPKPQLKPKPKSEQPKKAPEQPKKPAPVRKTEPAPSAKPAAVEPPTQAPAAASAPSTPSAAVSTAVPAKPASETFTEADYRANYKSRPNPPYPRLAQRRGWQGKVLLRVKITADGRSANVSVQQSSGHEMLDEAAVEAVRGWTFNPARRGDRAVESTVTIPISFNLND